MSSLKRILFTAMIVGVAATAYFAGTRTAVPANSKPQTPGSLIAEPAEITLENPTGVLLGEIRVPDSLLQQPLGESPAKLIVPELKK